MGIFSLLSGRIVRVEEHVESNGPQAWLSIREVICSHTQCLLSTYLV